MNIVGDGGGIYLRSGGATISGILKGKINVTADNPIANDHYAITADNNSSLYVAEDAKIMASAGKKQFLTIVIRVCIPPSFNGGLRSPRRAARGWK